MVRAVQKEKPSGAWMYELLECRDWIVRRNEVLTFIDDVALRRDVTLLIDPPPIENSEGGSPLLLPIALIEKHPPRDIRTYDRGGLPIPALTRTGNVEMTTAALSHGFGHLSERLCDLDLFTEIQKVVGEAPNKAGRAFARFAGQSRRVPEARKAISILRKFVRFFALYVEVAAEDHARIVRYQYDQEIMWDRKRYKLPSRSTPALIPIGGVSQGRSVHVVIEPPAGLAVDVALMVGQKCDLPCRSSRDDGRLIADIRPSTKRRFVAIDGAEHSARVHLYNAGKAANCATVACWLRPVKRRLPRYNVIYCGVALLSAIISTHFSSIQAQGASANGGRPDTGAVLVGILGLISIFAASPQEHPLASVILRPFRGCALCMGATVLLWSLVGVGDRDPYQSLSGWANLAFLLLGVMVAAYAVVGYTMCLSRKLLYEDVAELRNASKRRRRSNRSAAFDGPRNLPFEGPDISARLRRRSKATVWTESSDMYDAIHILARFGFHVARSEEEIDCF